MFKLIITKTAKADIREAVMWYNSKQKGLGKRLTESIKAKSKLIRQYPKACPIRYKNVRTAITEKFPYMIHYIDNADAKQVVIVAFFHTSINPQTWLKR